MSNAVPNDAPIKDASCYPVSPADIDVSRHFWEAFGNVHTENAARWIVMFMQGGTGVWRPFTLDQLDAFYRAETGDKAAAFWFCGLYRSGGENRWIVEIDGLLHVTEEFVRRCFEASPREGIGIER